MNEREVFLAVVEAGGFSAAANKLGTTPASVSRRIKALEERLGVRLLQRTTRKVRLTEAGERYHLAVGGLLRDLRSVEQQLGDEAGQPAGELRVVAPMSFGQRQLSPLLAEFAAAHPRLNVTLLLDDRETDLIAEGVDLAVRISCPTDSSLIARQIGTVAMRCCAAPAYLREHGHPAQPEDLLAHRCLHYSLVSEREEWTFRDAESLAVRGVYSSNNGDVLRDALLAGLGVGVMPDFLVDDAIRDGRLVHLLHEHERRPLALSVLYPSREYVPKRARLLVDFLVHELGGKRSQLRHTASP